MRAVEPLAFWAGRSLESLLSEWHVPRLVAYSSVPSTNDVARELAVSGAPELTTVLADEQSAGRGRFGRTWTAPAGKALLISIVLRPHGGPRAAPSAIPLRLGMAVARAVEQVCDVMARVKWPNDVLDVDGRKVAGVLCEASTSARRTFVIAGIGINVNQTIDDWPAEMRDTAASLLQLRGGPVDRVAVAGALLDEVRAGLDRIDLPLNAEERETWTRRDALHNQSVSVDGEAAGTAIGVTPWGALCLRTTRGSRVIWSGTVRPVTLPAPIGKEATS